jgi:hypothetical protein
MTLFSGFSSAFDTNVTKNVLGFTSPGTIIPTAIYSALYSTAIGNAKVVNTEWSTSGTAYVRQSFGIGASNWTLSAFVAGTGVVVTNANQVTYSGLTGGSPINLNSVGFIDASSGAGTLGLIFFADVTTFSVAVGVQVAFFVGDVSWTLN